jgi:hypothetical protein
VRQQLQPGVPFRVSEILQGNRDLNGDGGARDQVMHLCDANTNTTTNLGRRLNMEPISARITSEAANPRPWATRLVLAGRGCSWLNRRINWHPYRDGKDSYAAGDH